MHVNQIKYNKERNISFIVNQKMHAGAIELLLCHNNYLARRLLPPFKHLRRENCAAILRLQQTGASRNGAPDVDHVLLKLGAHVHGHALGAIGVGAPADAEGVPHRFGIPAVSADERRVL